MKTIKEKIMVFGTFDVLHKGHLNFFKQARALSKSPFLIVSVARGVNVKKIKKHKPINNDKKRLQNVRSCSLVDRALLGAKVNYLNHIVKEDPQIIALGYDQKAYVKGLKKLLAGLGARPKIYRLKSYFSGKYKTSIILKNMVK